MNLSRTYTLSQQMEKKIAQALQRKNVNLSDTAKIAECVLWLSDFYIAYPEEYTPWGDERCQIAYLAYFFPLNYMRAQAVIEEGNRFGFFQQFDSLVDFGSGLGSGSLGLGNIPKKYFIEHSPTAQKIHQELLDISDHCTWTDTFQEKFLTDKTLGIFSYSLTELSQIPEWASEVQGLMILEPATRQDGRHLLELRKDFMAHGWSAWAPCTHQEGCPLLEHTLSDWCHDRILFDQPDWFKAIEAKLPIKNKTLTMSYLLLSKAPRPTTQPQARITGDLLREKGKARQMVCRKNEREFFSWLSRNGEPQEIPRGSLVQWPDQAIVKSQETRPEQEIRILS